MEWKRPSVQLLNMNAEVGGYQGDPGDQGGEDTIQPDQEDTEEEE